MSLKSTSLTTLSEPFHTEGGWKCGSTELELPVPRSALVVTSVWIAVGMDAPVTLISAGVPFVAPDEVRAELCTPAVPFCPQFTAVQLYVTRPSRFPVVS